MNKMSIKYLKWAQQAGGAGWNRHVGPWLRRKANKRLRSFFKRKVMKEIDSIFWQTSYIPSADTESRYQLLVS